MARDYDSFIAFLTENRCLPAFLDNFYAYNNCVVLCRDIWDIYGGDEYFINRAFDWSQTPQGRTYWKEMDRRWELLCKDLSPAAS